MWIVTLAPLARSPNAQDRTCGGPAAIAQPVTGAVRDQVTPVGRVSPRVALLAVPGPALLTTIVKAAGSPAVIVPVSAVLRTLRVGHWTVIVTISDDGLPSLVEAGAAWFVGVPPLALLVGRPRGISKLA